MSSKKNAKAKKKDAAEPVSEKKDAAEPASEKKDAAEPASEKKESLVTEEIAEEKESAEESSAGNAVKDSYAASRKASRTLPVALAVLALGLLTAVIVLSVRLGDMTGRLESVQTMSNGLQKELDSAKREVEVLKSNETEPEIRYVEVLVTPTPGPTPTPRPKYIVCVDAGHGEWDSGAVILDEDDQVVRKEKDDNLRMAKQFRDAMEQYDDVEVVMTRETDVFLELASRTDVANDVAADVLISFHRNALYQSDDITPKDSVHGIEFWIHNTRPKPAQDLAEAMLSAVLDVGGMANRGVKYGSMSDVTENYAINRRAKMTSMIVEFGFITSEGDNEAYDTYGKQYAEKMAEAVFKWLEEEDAKKQKIAAEE